MFILPMTLHDQRCYGKFFGSRDLLFNIQNTFNQRDKSLANQKYGKAKHNVPERLSRRGDFFGITLGNNHFDAGPYDQDDRDGNGEVE